MVLTSLPVAQWSYLSFSAFYAVAHTDFALYIASQLLIGVRSSSWALN